MLLTNYKQTTDALLSKLKDNYSNKGIGSEIPSLIKNVFNNDNNISINKSYQIVIIVIKKFQIIIILNIVCYV